MANLMKMFNLMTIAVLVSSCASSGSQSQLTTHSGQPEIFIKRQMTEVKNRMVQGCVSNGGMLENISDSVTICAYQDNNIMRSALTQLAIGNSYSTTPLTKIQFTYLPQENGTKIYAQLWLETQMALGQTRRVPLRNGKLLAQVQTNLERIKRELEAKNISSTPTIQNNNIQNEIPLNPL